MRFRILGPLSVIVDGRSVVITATRDRIVLAMLLLNPGRVLSVDSLIEAVWGDGPPVTARAQLQNCISRLRRILPFPAIGSDPAGYQINIAADDVDSAVFVRLTAAGRRDDDPAPLRAGLDLWRGDALSGVESETVRRAAASLDEQHGTALEDWAELELAAGHQRDLIGPLTDLAKRFPLRERLRGQLMRALAAAGRTGEALAEFRRAREELLDELGVEPGRPLQELYRRLLSGDAGWGGGGAERTPERPVVRSLPRTVADFTGREELIDSLLRRAAGGGPAVLALDGMAGSGKTTLALHLAARLGDRFPDAHLYVDLHGHSDREPLDPSAALLVLLRRLGVAADRVPESLDERIDLWRGELAGRRTLLILDNAASSAQVLDLLPASPEALVLVTSRRRLLGLDGVQPESLPVLDEAEAVALLARIAGDRVFAEPDAAIDLVRRCGGLPLAIRLAGARLAHRPRWRVADLVRRFGDAVLPELAAESRTVAGAFALSFGQLPESMRQVFRLLGVHPGRLYDVPAVAALTGRPADEAGDLLDDLIDVHLIEEPEPDVFRMHDLLHEYASALATELPPDERHAALDRLLDLELGAALCTLSPTRLRPVLRELGLSGLPSAELAESVVDPAARLDRGRLYLGALSTAAIEAGRSEFSWQFARATWWRLSTQGYGDEVRAMFIRARAEARRVGNGAAEATCANYLASGYFRRAQFDDALALLQEAIRIRRTLGDLASLSASLGNLCAIYSATDRFVEAAPVAEEALRLAELAGEAHGVIIRLDARSMILNKLGLFDEALRLQGRRLLAVLESGDETHILHCRLNHIVIRRRSGRIAPPAAERALRTIVRGAIRVRYLEVAAEARAELGDVLRQRGRYAEAAEQIEQALEMFDQSDEVRFRARTFNTLGAVRREAGDPVAAAELYRRAGELAKSVSQPSEVARSYLGLGDCATDPEVARSHWRAALEIFTRLQVPERAEAAARLQEVDSQNEETGVSHCAI
jgi:DNA-binding SARP family transcriptional activator/tetratricopeptide (TPR) repeat protein